MHTISEKSPPEEPGWNRAMNLPNLAAGKRANLLVTPHPVSYTTHPKPASPKIFYACGFPGVFNILLDGDQGAADEAVLNSAQ